MHLLSMEKISKSYGSKILLENITLGLDEGEKIGLIGVNGTGKSTFLKIIAGVDTPDQGKITLASGAKIEYLPQNPAFDAKTTVLEQIFRGDSPALQLVKEYQYALERLQEDPQDIFLQKKLLHLQSQMDALGAWQIESEAKTILTKLGVVNFAARVGQLSGGQRKRIALAGALIDQADLLILDEPTNHLDNEAVNWLEQYLHKYKGALLMITHDRYFLDRVVNKIIELEQGKLYSYSGNYSDFLVIKAEWEEQQSAFEQKRQSLYRKELAWIKRGAKARTTKQKARIERFEKLQAGKPEISLQKMEISAGASRLGKKVVELEQVDKSFEGKKLIAGFTYLLLRDDRIGIIGPNGSGKSTLLNLLAAKNTPDQGQIEWGPTVKIGYFSQENTEMDNSLRVIEYLKEVGEYVTTANGELISAAKMLEKFLFPSHQQWSLIANLSGGEKRRLYLLRILMEAPNVLLLDEPTNDLDVQTLTILEDYLDEFPGAVVVVSHDRYFLDRVVEKILAFEGGGIIRQYVGNYSDYWELKQKEQLLAEDNKSKEREEKKKDQEEKTKERSVKFTFQERKEYEEIEQLIAQTEEELALVEEKINGAGSDYVLLQDLLKLQQEQRQKLEVFMERWVYLNELAEEIAKSKKK